LTPITLGPLDLALAACLVVIEALLSLVLGLGIHRQVTIAAARMVVQLLLVGYALRFVFALGSPAVTLLAVALMALIAAREVAVRPEQRLRRAGNYVISVLAVVSVTTITAVLALTTAIRPHPWWMPQYAIPLAGIILGSVLNSASLALDHVLETVRRERAAIEAQLALGVPFPQASRPLLRSAIRRGVLPIINQMSAAGLITLPGIMTGQILAGLDPVEAVKYQILLMFLLAGSSVLAAAAVALLALRRLTDARERLRLDWLIGTRD
jgi:putative ABC transport system permease protein